MDGLMCILNGTIIKRAVIAHIALCITSQRETGAKLQAPAMNCPLVLCTNGPFLLSGQLFSHEMRNQAGNQDGYVKLADNHFEIGDSPDQWVQWRDVPVPIGG